MSVVKCLRKKTFPFRGWGTLARHGAPRNELRNIIQRRIKRFKEKNGKGEDAESGRISREEEKPGAQRGRRGSGNQARVTDVLLEPRNAETALK